MVLQQKLKADEFEFWATCHPMVYVTFYSQQQKSDETCSCLRLYMMHDCGLLDESSIALSSSVL